MLRASHRPRRPEWVALALCLGVSILLLCLPDGAQFAVADGLGAVLTRPWWRARNFAEDLRTVRSENDLLLARIVEHGLLEATAARALSDSLRGVTTAGLDPGFRSRLAPCAVVARRLGRTATMVAVRSEEPLRWRPLQAVVSAEGLVGRIRTARGPFEAWVELLAAPEFAVGCEVERTGLLGVFRRRGGRFVLDMVGRDEDGVAEGDLVITSGIAEVPPGSAVPWASMPRGLPVGRVTSVGKRAAELFLDVRVEPLASLTHNRTLFLVLGEDPWPAPTPPPAVEPEVEPAELPLEEPAPRPAAVPERPALAPLPPAEQPPDSTAAPGAEVAPGAADADSGGSAGGVPGVRP